MLRTRLWMGTLLAGLTVGVLLGDQPLAPYYPFLLVFLLILGTLGTLELRALIDASHRPPVSVCLPATLALLLVHWLPLWSQLIWPIWEIIAAMVAAAIWLAFLVEMARYREPGRAVLRMALSVWLIGYLGLLPCFLARLRWLPDDRAALALALAIFVPKGCDIGAYFTGRALGRHKMTPRLSPGKTWEGTVGGLLLAVLVAVGIASLGPVLPSRLAAIGFGLTVGLAGVLGDLAESLIKRDVGAKDASRTVPGFGGILDVIDSVIFAAPVAYLWLR